MDHDSPGTIYPDDSISVDEPFAHARKAERRRHGF
jgi:hypothetical protein